MQRLLCLGLDGTPASELFAGTVKVWCDSLGKFSPERLAIAFDRAEATATRWPSPAQIAELLPGYEHVYHKPAPVSRQIAVDPEQAARSKARIQKVIDECAAKLGVKLGKAA